MERDPVATRALTRALNGHALDLNCYTDGKSRYQGANELAADGGVWADYRKVRHQRRSLARAALRKLFLETPAASRPETLARLEYLLFGHDARLWGGNPDIVMAYRREGSGAATTDADAAWEIRQLQARDLLASDRFHLVETGTLSGGAHDHVRRIYYELAPRYEMKQYRLVLGRRGRLPVRLYAVKADAERLILALHRQGISHTTTAQIFKVNERTVRRTITRRRDENLNVRLFPRDEGASTMTTAQLATRDDVREMEGRLADALNSLQTSVNALLLRWPNNTEVREAADWLLDD